MRLNGLAFVNIKTKEAGSRTKKTLWVINSKIYGQKKFKIIFGQQQKILRSENQKLGNRNDNHIMTKGTKGPRH